MPGQPEEARRTEQVAQTPEQQAAKQGAEQQRDADAARVQEEAADHLIEAKLRELHGDHWWKRGVTEAVRLGCEARKREKERPLESSYHPIYYAYVDDYKTMIIRVDNFKAVFAAVFDSKIELEACFAWVARVRDPVAHVRPISDDDYQRFVVAAKWIQTAMKRAYEEI